MICEVLGQHLMSITFHTTSKIENMMTKDSKYIRCFNQDCLNFFLSIKYEVRKSHRILNTMAKIAPNIVLIGVREISHF